MKLRTLTNSIRLRLSQSEVTTISQSGIVSDEVNLPAGNRFSYSLASTEASLDVRLEEDKLSVLIPKHRLRNWADAPDIVGIQDQIQMTDGKALRILIEKDFACLKPRDNEDESDLFANPDADLPKC